VKIKPELAARIERALLVKKYGLQVLQYPYEVVADIEGILNIFERYSRNG